MVLIEYLVLSCQHREQRCAATTTLLTAVETSAKIFQLF